MHLTIDIVPDLESQLLDVAARHGIDPGQYVVNAVRERLQSEHAPQITADQSRLLDEINQGLSPAEWTRYYSLVDKRQQEAITCDEFAELEATSDRIAELNSRRMELLAELAHLRGISLPVLMDQLGIIPPPVI